MGKIMLNDKQYGVGGINKAEDVSYDNTSSGMTATNVQDAVDELNTGLTSVGFSNPEVVTFPFTADRSGMLLVQADATSSSQGAYIYIKDQTIGSQVVTAYNLSGVAINQYYPCVKGHTYAVSYKSNVNNIVHRFFPMGV